jgi:dTDP-4-amino-4,6-dideoxygalactose transaminase
MIQLVDLKSQYAQIKDDVQSAISDVLDSTNYIQGPFVEKFEKEFLELHDARYGAGVSNGTSAISLVLEGLGIGRGDEVIVPAHTFFATAEAVCNVGAKPVIVDIDANTYCMDPSATEAAITSKTKAIIPVHIYGNVADLNSLTKIAKMHSLHLIEDAAQAHFAKYDGKLIGSFGDASTFSFYPGKNLGAYGDAGFIVTKSLELCQRVKKLRDHGRSEKYEHDLVGSNQRMSAIQAAVLSVKLKHILGWTEKRRVLGQMYDSRLKPMGFKVMSPTPGAEPVYHLYVVEVSNRSAVMAALKEKGIATGIHYPIPLHRQPALRHLGTPPRPVTERVAEQVVSLPLFPELTTSQLDMICEEFLKVAKPTH